MKIAIMVVGIILITIGCATVPTGPLAPGELRLTSLKAPETIKAGMPYDVIASFQTNDPVQIVRGCFSWTLSSSPEGPYCFPAREVNLEAKTFKVRLLTNNPNFYTLTCCAEYQTGGKTNTSNPVSTGISVQSSIAVKVSANGQTTWPEIMESQEPSKSNSPVAAYLPANTKIIPPAIGLPPEKAAWSGKWRGWAGNDKEGDARLAVEKVTTEGAAIIYSFASNTVKPFARRLPAKFVGNELQADLSDNVRVIYRMRPDGHIEFMWMKGKSWMIGILSKEQ